MIDENDDVILVTADGRVRRWDEEERLLGRAGDKAGECDECEVESTEAGSAAAWRDYASLMRQSEPFYDQSRDQAHEQTRPRPLPMSAPTEAQIRRAGYVHGCTLRPEARNRSRRSAALRPDDAFCRMMLAAGVAFAVVVVVAVGLWELWKAVMR